MGIEIAKLIAVYSADVSDFSNKTAKVEKGAFLIKPRLIQKATPLFSLIKDNNLRTEFVGLLQAETRITKTLSKETFDFEVINAIHEILFWRIDENTVELRESYLSESDSSVLASSDTYEINNTDGVICEALTLKNIVERLNKDRNKKDEIDVRTFGRTLAKRFSFETEKCEKRASKAHKLKAIIFDAKKLTKLFESYSLPVSADFNRGNGGKPLNVENKQVAVPLLNLENAKNNFNGGSIKDNQINGLEQLPPLPLLKNQKTSESNTFDEKMVDVGNQDETKNAGETAPETDKHSEYFEV